MHQKCQERLDEMIALQSLLESAEVYYNVQLKEVAVVVNVSQIYFSSHQPIRLSHHRHHIRSLIFPSLILIIPIET
ncbi:unnamed protein product [Trichobilharzia regenti]|nr:unnamed protein product [Trichobilharzia regenti]